MNIKKLVENESFIIKRKEISAIVEMKLKIKIYIFQSQFMKLANIMLVLYSKIYINTQLSSINNIRKVLEFCQY